YLFYFSYIAFCSPICTRGFRFFPTRRSSDLWYNVRADMKTKPAPLLNPATGAPMGYDDLRPVFCDELIRQELDNDTREIPIPARSEEHTSELQSRFDLVCRLLLETTNSNVLS